MTTVFGALIDLIRLNPFKCPWISVFTGQRDELWCENGQAEFAREDRILKTCKLFKI